MPLLNKQLAELLSIKKADSDPPLPFHHPILESFKFWKADDESSGIEGVRTEGAL